MYRIYITRMVVNTTDQPFPVWRSKYIGDSSYKRRTVGYGAEKVAIVVVFNPSQTDHDSWVANPDCMGLPENLDQNMTTGAVNAAQSFLESLNIPAGWINTSRTYRQVVKIIIGLFQFAHRWNGISKALGLGHSSPFKEGMNLDTRYNQMDMRAKVTFRGCFDASNIDRTMLTDTSTIRDALFELGQQFAIHPDNQKRYDIWWTL